MLSSHRVSPSLSADLLYQFPRRPTHIFLIKKSGSSHVDQKASDLAGWLHTVTPPLTLYIEQSVADQQGSLFPDCIPYDPSRHRHVVEIVITMGGDGTALHYNSLFNDSHTIPMLLSFAMGTLGFLTPFNYGDSQTIITKMLRAYKRGGNDRNNKQQQTAVKEEPSAEGGSRQNDNCEDGQQDKREVNGEKEVRKEGEGTEDGKPAGEEDEYVISLCPRMRLLCQVWKKKKKQHVELSAEEQREKDRQKRRRRKLSHGITDGEDESTSSEEEEGEDQQEEGEQLQDGEEMWKKAKAEEDMRDKEKQRVARIEAKQCRIDRQRCVEQQIVQKVDHSPQQDQRSAKTDRISPPTTSSEEGQVYLAATFHPLNELLFSGPTPRSLTAIDLSLIQEDGKHQKVSTVLADALIISTATGSTAYSMSAGGPMVSPNSHCIIITPVCPHTLSFRPLILPDSTHLLLSVSPDSRTRVGIIVCDGLGGRRVRKGEWVTVRQDSVPVWSVNYVSKNGNRADIRREREEEERQGDAGIEIEGPDAAHGIAGRVDSSVLWFRSISSKLKWNTREGTNGQLTEEMKENAVDVPGRKRG